MIGCWGWWTDHIAFLVVLVLDDENGVETGENGGHKVDVLLAFRVVPATEDRIGRREHRTARVQRRRYSRLSDAFIDIVIQSLIGVKMMLMHKTCSERANFSYRSMNIIDRFEFTRLIAEMVNNHCILIYPN